MSTIDALVSRMITRAHQVERALHNPGPWKVRVAGYVVPARRIIGPDHITFIAQVELDGPAIAELICDKQITSAYAVDGRGMTQIVWEYAIEEPVIA